MHKAFWYEINVVRQMGTSTMLRGQNIWPRKYSKQSYFDHNKKISWISRIFGFQIDVYYDIDRVSSLQFCLHASTYYMEALNKIDELWNMYYKIQIINIIIGVQ